MYIHNHFIGYDRSTSALGCNQSRDVKSIKVTNAPVVWTREIKNDRYAEVVRVVRLIAGEIIVFDISTYLKGLM